MEHREKVSNYYTATHIDYRALWTGSKDRAMHFGYYDEETRSHQKALERLNKVLADSAKIKETDSVLDAGCGYGGSSMWLAENVGCSVVGITIVQLQLSKGQRYVRERNLEDKVRIIEADFAKTPFPADSFNVYWAIESVLHAEDRQIVLDEAYRILKPGGRVVIAEYTLREDPQLSKEEVDYLQPWLDAWAMPSLVTPTEYKEILSRSGFSNIHVTDVTNHVRPSFRRLKTLSILNYPIALLIAPFFFRPERLQNYYASKRQICALEKGLWEYSIITAQKS